MSKVFSERIESDNIDFKPKDNGGAEEKSEDELHKLSK